MASTRSDAPAVLNGSKLLPSRDREGAGALRVLLVSDVRIFRDGVANLLAAHGQVQVVGSAALDHAAGATATLQPDIVLYDSTPAGSLALVRRLAESVPDARIVAFGRPESDGDVLALAAAGVAGYVPRDASAADLIAALRCVMRDELICSPKVAASLYHQVAALSRGQAGEDVPPLTPRELEIAQLLDRGLSNKDIARHLGIEATTVKNHVHRILAKLQVRRRGEAAARVRAGLGAGPLRLT